MSNSELTNERAIARWSQVPKADLVAMDPAGDFGKRHLVNPVIFRMLGDVRGARILDAGCGQGYLSRLLAELGAHVVGVEPADSLFEYCVTKENEHPLGISYMKADLALLPDLGQPFDAVVASMVFCSIPDWKPALASCVRVLRPGGLLVFALNHPSFERLRESWKGKGHLKVSEYLQEYAIEGPHGTDWHRPLSMYLNETVSCGCRLLEMAEPGLDPAIASEGPPGIEAYIHLPNFVLIAAERN